MKKIKNLSILLLAVIMSSTGLVSCIDNEISPQVEEIYKNQALLIASQAALVNAQASYQNALAAVQDAQAASILAGTQRANDVHNANLPAIIAQAETAAEMARIALETAQMAWEADMVALQAAIDEAYVALASTYFSKYQAAEVAAISRDASALARQISIDRKSLFLVAPLNTMSIELWFTLKNQDLADLEAKLVADEQTKLDLEQAIANATMSDREQQVRDLEAEEEANDVEDAQLDIDKSILKNEKEDLKEELIVLLGDSPNELNNQYAAKQTQITNKMNDSIAKENAIESLTDTNVDLAADIASYDADLLILEGNVTTAEGDLATAEMLVTTTEATYGDNTPGYPYGPWSGLPLDPMDEAAIDAYIGAIGAPIAIDGSTGSRNTYELAHTAWYDLDADVAGLAANVNIAANNWALADAALAGSAALVTSTGATLVTADADYLVAKAAFEANPFGYDYTVANAGPDGAIAEYDPAGVALNSFSEITSFTSATVVGLAAPSYDTAVDVVAGADVVTLNGVGTFVPADVTLYFDVSADDDVQVPTANTPGTLVPVVVGQILSNQDIYNNATINLDAAQTASDNAIAADANAIANEASTKVIYDDLNVVLVSGVADLIPLKADLVTALNDMDAARDAKNDAVTALGVDPSGAPYMAVVAAELAVTNHEGYTPADMQLDIEQNEADILQYTSEIGVLTAKLIKLRGELAAILAQLNASSSAEAQAKQEEILAKTLEIKEVNAQLAANAYRNNQIGLVIAAINLDETSTPSDETLEYAVDALEMALASTITAIDTDIVDIDACKNAIAGQEINVDEIENEIAKLEAQKAAFEVEAAGYRDIAAKYWDLMQAALAS